VVQRPSTSPFQGEDRGFESRRGYHPQFTCYQLEVARPTRDLLQPVGPLISRASSVACSLLLILYFGITSAALAEEPTRETRRGPTELRDEHLLAQDRLTLPAFGPDTVGRGRWMVRTSLLWLNSFSWTQDVPGENPEDRWFLIDGETRTLDVTVRYGVRANFDVGLRVPLRWRGGGDLDPVIDTWHRIFGLPDGNRRDFLRDRFRVEGMTTEGRPFSWNDEAGTGFGNLEAEGRWRFHDGGREGWTAALEGRLAFPTGSGPFSGDGVGYGVQVVGARRLASSLDLFVGAGAAVQDDGPVRGVRYEPVRGQAFLALEWRPARRLSLVGETDAASRLIQNIDLYGGLHWMVNVSGRIDLSGSTRLELGFTENLEDQLATADFGIHFGLVWMP
jgi:Protein of unknown function (DUF3187)